MRMHEFARDDHPNDAESFGGESHPLVKSVEFEEELEFTGRAQAGTTRKRASRYRRFMRMTVIVCSVVLTIYMLYYVIKSAKIREREARYWKENESLDLFKSPYKLIARNRSDTDYIVPRIAHYVLVDKAELSFYEYLSMKSVRAFADPDILYVHHDGVTPSGVWWDRAVRRLNITTVPVFLTSNSIAGKKIGYKSHGTDALRIMALMIHGGFYLDTDVWLLPPPQSHNNQSIFEYYGKQEYTAGWENRQCTDLASAGILSSPSARFVRRWMKGYLDEYRSADWAYNAIQYPGQQARKHPEEVNALPREWMRPNWQEMDPLFDTGGTEWDLSNNDMIHWWHRGHASMMNDLLPEHFVDREDSELSQFERIAKLVYNLE